MSSAQKKEPETYPSPTTGHDPQRAIWELLQGHWLASAVSAAARWRLPDLIDEGHTRAEAIAFRLSLDPDAVYRLMRGLSRAGIFVEKPNHEFALTPLSRALLSSAPRTLQRMAAFAGSKVPQRAWAELDGCLRTGKSGVRQAFGSEIFDYLAGHHEDATLFHDAMTANTASGAAAIADSYDFDRAKVIADIGGGHGLFLATILKTHRSPRGILYDLPEVIQDALPYLESQGVAERCECFSGSFLEGVPNGADLYLIKNAIWNWSDDDAITILTHIRRALPSEGRALVIETLVPSPDSVDPNARFAGMMDIMMLVMTPGGRARTEGELKRLLDKAGLRHQRTIPTPEGSSIVEATPS